MSIDTVLPILIELKEKLNVSSLVIVNDELAYKGINENVVIKEALNYVGTVRYVGFKYRFNIATKILKLLFLADVIVRIIFGSKVIHFGLLDTVKVKRFSGLFKKNIFLFQSDSYKHSYSDYDDVVNHKPILNVPIGNNIVAFSDNMPELELIDEHKALYKLLPSRISCTWRRYVKSKSSEYFERFHSNIDFSNGCIVVILSFFGEMSEMRLKNSAEILYKNTIEALDRVSHNIPVLIKPHVFTDMNIVYKYIKNKKKYSITYLHPSMLCTKSSLFICNTYSTTMADARSMGVTTIEYSDYSKEILLSTCNKSIGYEYIDHFVNNNQLEFEKKVENILSDNSKTINKCKENNDWNKLILSLSI
jgi:hypothetical protein